MILYSIAPACRTSANVRHGFVAVPQAERGIALRARSMPELFREIERQTIRCWHGVASSARSSGIGSIAAMPYRTSDACL